MSLEKQRQASFEDAFCVYPIDGWFATKNSYNLTTPTNKRRKAKGSITKTRKGKNTK